MAFNGVIVGLVATQAQETLSQSSYLGSVGRWIAPGALLAAVVLVFASIGLAFAALTRTRSVRWTNDEIEAMPGRQSVTRSKAETQGSFLVALTHRIRVESESVNAAWRVLNLAFVALIAAVVWVGVYVGVLQCERSSSRTSARTRRPRQPEDWWAKKARFGNQAWKNAT